jgi:RNA recognition motif-containing protein
MSTRLFVGNVSFDANEQQLRDLFGQIGTVLDARIVMDRDTGRPRGFGFVEMSSASEASQAIQQLNGRELAGRALRVNEAEERQRARPPNGGRG